MSTQPVLPAPSTEHDIQTLLLAQINKLSQHHVTVSYTLIAVLVLVLGLVGAGGWLGLKSYEGQVARAEAIEARYQDAQKAFSEQLAANNAERAQDAQASAALISQIAKRAVAPLPPVIQSGLAASASAESVSKALQEVQPGLGTPEVTPDAKVALQVNQAQLVVRSLLAGTQAEADLGDTNALLGLANRDKSTLSNDLDSCTDLNLKANETIAGYKKAAIKSKWRKILDGMEKVGLILGGAAIGHGI